MATPTAHSQPAGLEKFLTDVNSVFFLLLHLACFAAIWTGIDATAAILCVSLYLVRMWAITAGYHRYFAHRSYRTSRVFQFILAWIGSSAAQKGVLWWAAHHRHHHAHSDQEKDLHSPLRDGFWWSHVGWILSYDHLETQHDRVKDLTRYPELRWLDRFHLIPVVLLAVACFLVGSWSGLVWGFFISTVLCSHVTFSINSLTHLIGKRRYRTGDDSRNHWFLALLTLGEGWHNNHHYYQTAACQGFFWWEIDLSYYSLILLEKLGIVWDVRLPPAAVKYANWVTSP
ncbi:MAG: fatty acid desaturase [Planctomycetes bacterium]|nr:fatty acid desaturase [Planctomycetota bacterium]